jgi:tetratricopeptide (TPR) repeat protein
MMTRKLRLFPIWLFSAAVIAFALPAGLARAQAPSQKAPGDATPSIPETAAPAQGSPVKTPITSPIKIEAAGATDSAVKPPDRAQAYYHLTLASNYEDKAASEGHPEYVTQAIEEYKLALDADPGSPQLSNALAELYFRTNRSREAESTARTLLKSAPDDIDAHKLLGRIYLRALGEGENAPSSTSSIGNTLDKAIAEFEKIVALQPKSVEERLVLGQLYTVKHDQKKAEEQFKTAQSMEPDSEAVVLNLARLYAESGDFKQAAKVIEAVEVADRSPKMEGALGAAYEQLKQPKEAIAAYQRAVDLEPGEPATLNALAQALLNDNQLDEALKQYKALAEADPENVGTLVHISEIERRQGKYEDALASIRKARKKDASNLEAGYNEGLLLDVLSRYDEAAQVYEKMVDQTSHANGAYTAEEKANRSIFLERLGAVYQEQNKVDQAVATFQKMIEMGGEAAITGFEAQVDTYSNAKLFDKAEEVGRKAVAANPKDLHIKLMLAGILVEENKSEEGLTVAKGLLGDPKQDQQVWLRLGQFYTELHRWKEAEEAFNKAEGLTTKKEDRIYLLFLRGALAERQKHFEPAEQFFRQVLDLDPANAMTLNYFGYMLADKGTRFSEALKLIRKAVELEPMNGAFLDSLGWVYFKMGEYELAEEDLRHAVERDRTDPTVHDHLGDLYEKTGRIRLAAAQWEISLAQFARSAPADVEPAEVAKVKKKLESARVKLAKENSAMGGQPKPE